MPDTPEPAPHEPISNGPNARPRDESISSTGTGLPNDTSHPVEVTRDEEERIAKAIKSR